MPRLHGWLALVFVIALVLGCGESGRAYKTARIMGTVTIDSVPVDTGTINFISEQKSGVAGGEDSAEIVLGKFTAKNVPHGSVRAYVIATKETGKMIHGSSQDVPEVASIVPEQYRQGIPLTIEGDESDRRIELVSKP